MLIAIPLLCWGMKENGSIVGMVPWLDEVLDCESVEHNFRVQWEGYYCPKTEEIFFNPPAEIAAMVTASAKFAKEQIDIA